MKLVELLDRQRILVPLEAANLEEAVGALARTIGTASGHTRRLEVDARERVATTVVTVGSAFLVHLRSADVSVLQAALGVAPTPLPRTEGGQQTGRIVVLLVAPPRESSLRLRAAGAFGIVLTRDEMVRALLAARDADDVITSALWAGIELPGYLTVRDVMAPQHLALRPDSTLGEAAQLMVTHDIPALPVVSETNEVLGVVTHRDLLRHLLPLYVKRLNSPDFRKHPARGRGTDPHEVPVRDVMDRTVLCVSDDQTLGEIATMMLNRNVDRFPVVRDGALVGFLTRGDIVRRLLGP